MNLEESDLFKEKIEKNTRSRRTVLISIVFCAILVAFLFILIMFLNYQDSITAKLFIDKKQYTIPNNFYKIVKDDSVYISVKDLANLLGYTYTKGEYNKFNEDEDSCYIQNNFEIVSISANSNKYKKYIELSGESKIGGISVTMKNKKGYNEIFTLTKPIEFIDGELFVALEDVTNMFNVKVNWKDYRYRFYTLDYLVTKATEDVAEYGFKGISGYYENLRSVLYEHVIVTNGSEGAKNKLYGVFSLEEEKEIISMKYNDIKFVQNARDYYITVGNGTMGILAEDGSTIIPPSEFDDINLLDDEQQLYLVEKDSEYGVLNKNGKTIVHAENDEIGLNVEKFELQEVENTSLIGGKCIPVKKDKKYGLYNLEGDLVLGLVYDGFGYISTAASTTSGNERSVLLIPPSVGINGMVINLGDLYGIFDLTTESIILPCSCSKIYAITKSGETTYYMEYNGEQYNLAEFLQANNLKNVDENGNLLQQEQSEEQSQTQDGGQVVNNQEESSAENNATEETTQENVTEEIETQEETTKVPVE